MVKAVVPFLLIVFFTLSSSDLYGQRVYEIDSDVAYITSESFSSVPEPGDTIMILAPRSETLKIYNISGDASKPIVFINSGGQVFINRTDHGALDFVDCKYIKVTGTGDPSFRYGFKLKGDNSGLSFSGLCSDCEAEFIELVGGEDTFFGLYAKKDFHGDPPVPYPQFNNLIIHDLYIHGVSAGMYIGETISPGMEFRHVRIYNNIIVDTKRESIQIANCVEDVEVHNNLMMNAGTQNLFSQGNALQIGGNTVARVYCNILKNSPSYGIIVFGMGNIEVFNNYCENNLGVFIDDRYWPHATWPINVHNNYFLDLNGDEVVKNMNEYNELYITVNQYNTDIPFFLNESEVPPVLVVKNNSKELLESLDFSVEEGVFMPDTDELSSYAGIGPIYSGIQVSERIALSIDQVSDLVIDGSIISPDFLVDEQNLNPTLDQHPVSSPWIPKTNLDNAPYSVEIDLGVPHYLESIYLHDIEFSGDFSVSVLNNGEWEILVTDSCQNFNEWNYHPLRVSAQLIRFSMFNSVKARINEVALYGYPLEGGGLSSETVISEWGNINSKELDDRYFYPNPASDYLSISCSDCNYTVKITDLAGKLCINTRQREIDISELSNGLYVVHLVGIDNNPLYSGKLIVSKQ